MTDDLASRIGALTGSTPRGIHEVGIRHGFRHLTGTLADGRAVFVKAAAGGHLDEDDGAAEAFAGRGERAALARPGRSGPGAGRARRGRERARP